MGLLSLIALCAVVLFMTLFQTLSSRVLSGDHQYYFFKLSFCGQERTFLRSSGVT